MTKELFEDIQILKGIIEQQRQELEKIYQSRSWKLTAPLRQINQNIKRIFEILLNFLVQGYNKGKNFLFYIFLLIISYIKQCPQLRKRVLDFLFYFPYILNFLRRVYYLNRYRQYTVNNKTSEQVIDNSVENYLTKPYLSHISEYEEKKLDTIFTDAQIAQVADLIHRRTDSNK